MSKLTKNRKEVLLKFDNDKEYPLTEAAQLVKDITTTKFDASIDLSVSGGTAPYTYDWDNNGSENPNTDPQDLSNLTAGTYIVIVTDNNLCIALTSVIISEPTASLTAWQILISSAGLACGCIL